MNIRMLPLIGCLVTGLFGDQASAQIVTARSYSGQFLAREFSAQSPWATPATVPVQTRIAGGRAFLLLPKTSGRGTNESKITLEPAVLVVTCERLKGIFLAELGLSDHWQGRIDLAIDSTAPDGAEPRLKAGRDWDGWNYELDLPRSLPPKILEEALVQTMLLELVNRNAGERSAEVPLWLIAGLSAHLEGYNLPTFMLQPGVQWASSNVRMEGSSQAREILRQHSPLSFQQLSWPQASDVSGDELKVYRACAQLFLEGLLQFPDGKDALRRMLAQLPQHLNWQTAFLLAFHDRFDQLLDVEKWWSLTAVGFCRGGLTPDWDENQLWKKIQESLEAPVTVHLDAGQMPVEARYTLQEVIAQWSSSDANEAIERSIAALEALPMRNSPELRVISSLYVKTLQDYLHGRRNLTHPQPLGMNPPPAEHLLKAAVIQQLNVLDQQRAALRPNPSSGKPQPQLSAAQNPASRGRH